MNTYLRPLPLCVCLYKTFSLSLAPLPPPPPPSLSLSTPHPHPPLYLAILWSNDESNMMRLSNRDDIVNINQIT